MLMNRPEDDQTDKPQKPGKRQPGRPEAPKGMEGIKDQLIRNNEGFTFKVEDDAFGEHANASR
jgi:hypothetical protein